MKTAKRRILKLDGKTELVEEKTSNQKPSESPSSSKKSKSNISATLDVGFTIATPIVGGVILGVYLDKRFGSAPRLTLILLFLGVIISFMNMIRILKEN